MIQPNIVKTALSFSQLSRETLTAFRQHGLSADPICAYLIMTMNCDMHSGTLHDTCTAKYIADELGMSRKHAHACINKLRGCGMLTV